MRAVALPLPGTFDVNYWKVWSYAAATGGAARIYGTDSGLSPHLLRFRETTATANYPPLAIYELGAVGRAYLLATGGRFPDTAALTLTIKGSIVLAEAGFALLLFLCVRPIGAAAARWAALAFWLNPAMLLASSALGYLDISYTLPAVGALAAAAAGWSITAGALIGAAVLTKPQALFLSPAVALAVWNIGHRRGAPRRALSALSGAIVVSAIIIAPVVAAGGTAGMLKALASMASHDMLSGNTCNVWWLVGYVLRAAPVMHAAGVAAALVVPADIVTISNAVQIGVPSPRAIGTVLTLIVGGWALWTARHARDLGLLSALGAFHVHAYTMLSAQVHENHLFAAIPLLVLAATTRRRLAPVQMAASAIFFANVYLFYGFGGGGSAFPRTATWIDATILVAALNCAALAWHAVAFKRECVGATSLRGSRRPRFESERQQEGRRNSQNSAGERIENQFPTLPRQTG